MVQIGICDDWQDVRAFEALAETLPELIFVTDCLGQNLYTNSAYQHYAGMSANQLLGDGFLSVIHPDDVVSARHHLALSQYSGSSYQREHRLLRHDGTYRWHLARGVPVLNAEGVIVRWIGACTDIDEIKEVQTALNDVHSLLKSVGEVFDGAFFAHNSNGNIVFSSKNILELSNFNSDVNSFDSNINALANELDIHLNKQSSLNESYSLLDSRDPLQDHRIYRNLRGPWPLSDGSIGQVIVYHDITQQQIVQSMLDRALEEIEALFEHIPILLWEADTNGKITRQNSLWQSYTGYPPMDSLASLSDIISLSDWNHFNQIWQACIDSGDVLDLRVNLTDQLEQNLVMHRVTILPVRDNLGQIVRWIGSARVVY